MATATVQGNGRGPVTAAAPEATQAPHGGLLERVVEATQQARYTIRDVETMAKRAAQSRMYGMDEAQAFTLMMICEAEGLHPIQALRRYHIIQGRPSMRADAMQAEFQRQGGTIEWVTNTDTECSARFQHPTQCPKGHTVSFSMADAKQAELGGKDNWRKYPGAMLRARVISTGIRMILPGVVVGVYTPEEVADFDAPPMSWTNPVIEAPIGTPEAPVAHQPPRGEPREQEVSEVRAWIRSQLTAANDHVHSTLVIEGKGEQYQPVAKEPQVAQALVTKWIKANLMEEAEVQKTNAKGELVRDPAKVGAAVQVAWSQDPEDVKADVRTYIDGKVTEVLRAAGVEVVDEDDEPANVNAED